MHSSILFSSALHSIHGTLAVPNLLRARQLQGGGFRLQEVAVVVAVADPQVERPALNIRS
jgi:hypothetical protein